MVELIYPWAKMKAVGDPRSSFDCSIALGEVDRVQFFFDELNYSIYLPTIHTIKITRTRDGGGSWDSIPTRLKWSSWRFLLNWPPAASDVACLAVDADIIKIDFYERPNGDDRAFRAVYEPKERCWSIDQIAQSEVRANCS